MSRIGKRDLRSVRSKKLTAIPGQYMTIEIAPRKYGRRVPEYQRRHPHTFWKRAHELLRDESWEGFAKLGLNPMYGTEVGRLYCDGTFNPSHCEAARIYAEVIGRHDHYFKDPKLPRTPGSPAYERSFRGNDDEIERRETDGSIKSYERKANRAKKAYKKLTGCLPNETARAVLDDLCIHDLPPPSHLIREIRACLELISKKFKHKFERTNADGKIKAWTAPPAVAEAETEVDGQDGGVGAG